MKLSRHNIKIGYAPTRRDIFSKEDAQRYKNEIEKKMRSWNIEYVNLDWMNDEGLLYDSGNVEAVVRRFREEKVDAVFSPHCNFGTEDAVAKLAKAMNKPFLLWGPRDEAPGPDGMRLRDSQCGLFATSKILQRFGVPFSYITNSRIDSAVFKNGFQNFIGAASVVKTFRSLKIGQIGTRPESFWSVMVKEAELLEKFNIEIVPITLLEIVNETKLKIRSRKDDIDNIVEDIKGKVDCSLLNEETLVKMAALKITISEWANKNGCSAIAIQCWNALQEGLGIMPCFINAELTDMGIPAACEADINGAVTAALLQASNFGSSSVFFADVTVRHPENDNAELLWHCGPFPYSLKSEKSPARIGNHYVLTSGCPGVAEWEIKKGDVSIARFDEMNGRYSLFMGEARGIDGPYTRGTYLWIEVDNWPLWEEKLIRGPYIHHVVGVHGKYTSVLKEACRYIPELEPDPVK